MGRWRARRPLLAATSVAIVAAMLATPPPALASPDPAVGVTDPTTLFATSFEPTEAQPTWINTVETDAAGTKKASGVDDTFSRGIPGSIADKVVQIQASGENASAGEVKENLNDGDFQSKWLVFTSTAWVQYKLSEPVAVVHYALTSANDEPGRDPQDWTLRGSQDGQAWVDLDRQTGQMFTERFQTKEYHFTNATAYLFYRLDITRNNGADIVQLAELQLSNGDTTPVPPGDMRSRVGIGPASSPTAKGRVGYTGLRAFEIRGRHVASGRGFSYNKVFEVDIPVTASTELSYLIFPEFVMEDLGNPSTYAAVDLAFSDGTYLSDLGAVDQRGEAGPALASGRVGRHPARDPVLRWLLAWQQLPGDRGPARLQLLDPDDQRRLQQLAVRVPPDEQRGQPAGVAGVRHQPRAQPVDGGPADLPDDAIRRDRRAGRQPDGADVGVRPRERDRPAALLQRLVRQRHPHRDRAHRPRRLVPVHVPRGQRQPGLRQPQQRLVVDDRRRERGCDGVLRQPQRPVDRRHPAVHLRQARQAGRGQRHAAGRQPGLHRLRAARRRDRPGRDDADRHLAHRHRPGAAQPGAGGRTERHLRGRARPGPHAVGPGAGHHRGRGRLRGPARHPVLEPLPAQPLPELR